MKRPATLRYAGNGWWRASTTDGRFGSVAQFPRVAWAGLRAEAGRIRPADSETRLLALDPLWAPFAVVDGKQVPCGDVEYGTRKGRVSL